MTPHHCTACEVGWTGPAPCWICGQPGQPGDVVIRCLNRPVRNYWGPALWEQEAS